MFVPGLPWLKDHLQYKMAQKDAFPSTYRVARRNRCDSLQKRVFPSTFPMFVPSLSW